MKMKKKNHTPYVEAMLCEKKKGGGSKVHLPKSIDPCQPTQFERADVCRNFMVL